MCPDDGKWAKEKIQLHFCAEQHKGADPKIAISVTCWFLVEIYTLQNAFLVVCVLRLLLSE